MSIVVIDDGKRVKIPKHVYAGGEEAVRKFLAEQHKANEVLRNPAPPQKKQEED